MLSVKNDKLEILDVVAVLMELPEHHISLGQVGAIVDILAPNVYEVEFCNKKGETITILPLSGDHLLLLHYDAEEVA